MAGKKCPVSPQDIVDWLQENPGWYASRWIWIQVAGGGPETRPDYVSFHYFRRLMQLCMERKLIRWRVRHPIGNGRQYPVYEYRGIFDVDNLTDE